MADSRTIDGSTKVPLVWAGAIIVAISGALFALGAAHWRLQALDGEFSKFRETTTAALKEAGEKSHAIELRQTAVEGDIRRMADSVQSIDRKLDRVIQDRYPQPR